ncbi:MAG: hypothetical protein U0Q07_17130 [Acidimicrobiales bacterium]
MPRHAGPLGVLLCTAALLVGACSSGSDSTPSAQAPTTTATGSAARDEPPPEVTPEVRGMDQLGALLDPEGRLSKDQALGLWAARISPLPGVTPLPRDQVADVDVSLIKARVASWLPELTADQQAIVRVVVAGRDPVELSLDDAGATPSTGTPGITATTIDTSADAPPRAQLAAVRVGMVTDAELRLAAVEARARFERLNGGPPGIPIRWSTADLRTPDPDHCADGAVPGSTECPWIFDSPNTGAETNATTNPDGTLLGCRIIMNRDVIVPADGAEARRFMVGAIAHEMYHCQQHAIAGSPARYHTMPEWVREGTAAFFGEKAVDGSLYSHRGWWRRWLQEPERSTFARSYDALGLMWLVDTDLGAPLTGRLADVVRASMDSGSAAAFDTLTRPAGPNLWTRWATHLANLRGPGTDEWHPQGPYATDDRPVAQRFGLPVDGGPVAVGLPTARSAKAVRTDLAGEVVEVQTPTATGVGLIDTAGTRHTLNEGSTTRLCVNPAGCPPCPDGRPLRTDQDVAPGIATWYLASLGGTEVRIEAQSRDRACGGAPPAAGSGSVGDPEQVCNRALPPAEAAALLGEGTTTGHDLSSTATNDLVNSPAYACRWTNGSKYLWATLRTAPDGAQEYHGLDQFTVDNEFVNVPGLGSEARLVRSKPAGRGNTQLEIVDSGNLLTVAAEGSIASNEGVLIRAGRTIADNWP